MFGNAAGGGAPGQGQGQQPPAPPLCVNEKNLARQFVDVFYRTFDGNRAALGGMYRDASTVSFEGDTLRGGNAFMGKLAGMGIPPTAAHRVVTVDAQPSVAGSGAIVVFVTGEYAGSQYSEVFQLVPEGQSFYVHNDIFRVGASNAFNVPPDAVAVVRGFVEWYYPTFDTARQNLAALYKPHSYLTIEEDVRQGQASILDKLSTLPPVQHDASSLTADVHQINGNALLLVFVTGKLRVDENPLNFSETFVLVQEGAGYYIGNHVFKLKYG